MEGREFSHYRVLNYLGAGGMGLVYRAEDTRLKRTVALKFLPADLLRDADAKERFEQEAQAASRLDHPNICTIYEFDHAPDGGVFIAMAYCDGPTLKTRLQDGPLPVIEAIDIASQIAAGLEKAHHAGLVHRDIKPANLVCTSDGLVKIVDFGIAKLLGQTGPTKTGTTIGTIGYMAPEQCDGSVIDHRADLWALGVVLYEMLAGRAPFSADRDAAIINNILHTDPPPLSQHRRDIPGSLQRVVTRTLTKDRDARYASAAELRADLFRARDEVVEPSSRKPRTSERRRTIASAAMVVVAVLAIAAGWYVRRAMAARAAEPEIREIEQLADRDDYFEAVRRLEGVSKAAPGHPRLTALWQRISVTRAITTEPAGADVYVRATKPGTEWLHLGHTPIAQARIPRGQLRWKVMHDGFARRTRPPATGYGSRICRECRPDPDWIRLHADDFRRRVRDRQIRGHQQSVQGICRRRGLHQA